MSYFTRESLAFLSGLKRNNKKSWFEAHRADYDRHGQQPMAQFVQAMDLRPSLIAPVVAPKLKKRMGALSEESMLKRTPRGFECGHPAERWLKHQSFTVGRKITDVRATSPKLTSLVGADFAAMLPLVRWLNGTLGLEA